MERGDARPRDRPASYVATTAGIRGRPYHANDREDRVAGPMAQRIVRRANRAVDRRDNCCFATKPVFRLVRLEGPELAPLCRSGTSHAPFHPKTLIRRPDVAPATIHSGQPARVAGRSLAWLQSGFTRSGRLLCGPVIHLAIAYSATTRRRPLSNFSRKSPRSRIPIVRIAATKVLRWREFAVRNANPESVHLVNLKSGSKDKLPFAKPTKLTYSPRPVRRSR